MSYIKSCHSIVDVNGVENAPSPSREFLSILKELQHIYFQWISPTTFALCNIYSTILNRNTQSLAASSWFKYLHSALVIPGHQRVFMHANSSSTEHPTMSVISKPI